MHNLASEKRGLLNAVISKILNEKGRLYCAFIDLKMAFDNIYRNTLWFNMHKCKTTKNCKECICKY